MNKKLLLKHKTIDICLQRLSLQLLESIQAAKLNDICLIGLQPRGIIFSDLINSRLKDLAPELLVNYGQLDVSFYRDDFRRNNKIIVPNKQNINFSIEEKHLVLVDDVLFTGRSINAALKALGDLGRPKNIEFMVLIDRKYQRELPLSPNYTGKQVDTRSKDKVIVDLRAKEKAVWITTNKDESIN